MSETFVLKLVDKAPMTALVIVLLLGIAWLVKNPHVKAFFKDGININIHHTHTVSPQTEQAFTGAMLSKKRMVVEYELSDKSKAYIDKMLEDLGRPRRRRPRPNGNGRAADHVDEPLS